MGRKALLVAVLAAAVLAGAGIGAAVAFRIMTGVATRVPSPSEIPTQQPKAALPANQSGPTGTPQPALTPLATPRLPTPSLASPQAPSATPGGAPVDFDILVSQVGPPKTTVLFNVTLQANLNASLTNTGDTNAHNVRVQVRARVGSAYLKLNDADPFVVTIGDLPARTAATTTLPIEVKMSLLQGNQAQSEGITFELTVLSSERTKRFPDLRCTQTGCTSP